MVYAVIPFIAMANGLSLANLSGLVSRSVGNDRHGEILGINSSIQSIAQAIPPILSGIIAAAFVATAPIIIGGVLILISSVIFITHRKRFKLS